METYLSNSLGLASAGALVALMGAAIWLVLWMTRPPNDAELDRSQRLWRHLAVLAWLIIFVSVVFLAAGVLVHQDAAWYQTADPGEQRLPPAFRTIVFLCYPAYTAIGGALYLYLKTRLPGLLASLRWPLFVAVGAPFLFLPASDPAIFDQRLTLSEGLYLAAYWGTMFLWLAFGMAPLVITTTAAMIGIIEDQGDNDW
jgi:methane/ammonia monooxygenase subunit C